jgi:hypothetical protein
MPAQMPIASKNSVKSEAARRHRGIESFSLLDQASQLQIALNSSHATLAQIATFVRSGGMNFHDFS